LTFPITSRPTHREAEDSFIEAMEPQVRMLIDSGGTGTGEAHLVTRHLVSRIISELMVAMHLARHGYLSESYNALRTAYETADLADLVAADPAEATKWVNTKKGHRDFSPGAVRTRLGRDSFDEVYSEYSELAHPRFAGARFGVFGKRPGGDDTPQLLVQIGPTMLDEFPDFWFLLMAMTTTVGRLMVATASLHGMGEVTEQRWDAAARASGAQLKRMAEVIEKGLAKFGIDGDDFAESFDSLDSIIEEVNREHPDP
jgi:hypothetical protein